MKVWIYGPFHGYSFPFSLLGICFTLRLHDFCVSNQTPDLIYQTISIWNQLIAYCEFYEYHSYLQFFFDQLHRSNEFWQFIFATHLFSNRHPLASSSLRNLWVRIWGLSFQKKFDSYFLYQWLLGSCNLFRIYFQVWDDQTFTIYQ